MLGAVLWTAWDVLFLLGLLRAGVHERWAAGLAAAVAAVLALAIQTDVIGDPWVAYCLWALGGALVATGPRRVAETQLRPRAATLWARMENGSVP